MATVGRRVAAAPLRARGLASSADAGPLAARMQKVPLPAAASRSPSTLPAAHHAATCVQELSALFPAGEQSPLPSLPRSPPRKPPPGLRRKMVEHELPAYAVGNFHTLTFILTRMPRRADFPHEWCADWPRAPALRAALSPPGVAQDLPAAEHRSPLQTLLQCKVARNDGRRRPAGAARRAAHMAAQRRYSTCSSYRLSPRASAPRRIVKNRMNLHAVAAVVHSDTDFSRPAAPQGRHALPRATGGRGALPPRRAPAIAAAGRGTPWRPLRHDGGRVPCDPARRPRSAEAAVLPLVYHAFTRRAPV